MSEQSIRKSFLVRVYRFDPQDQGQLHGTVEVIDESGVNLPFADAHELGSLLDMLVKRSQAASELENDAG